MRVRRHDPHPSPLPSEWAREFLTKDMKWRQVAERTLENLRELRVLRGDSFNRSHKDAHSYPTKSFFVTCSAFPAP